MTPRTFPAVPVASGAVGAADLPRADIEVSGLEHGGPSYELRIFLENPDAHATTPATAEHGYAGSIHVYGMGMPADSGTSQRKTRSIIATDAVRAAAGGGAVGVTLVALPVDPDGPAVELDGVGVSVLVADTAPEADEGARPA